MSKKSVIIVEDEADMAELIAMRLRRDGYAVEAVGDGGQALSRIRAGRPDLVLLDIMLPGMSGIEVLRRLRGDVRTSGIPVVMLTARAAEADQVVGLELGADDYITKPFSLPVLSARVAAVLRRASGGERAAGAIEVGLLRIDPDRHLVQVDGKAVSATATEFRLLLALAAAGGRVLTRNQLIDQSIGPDVVVTDRTIDVHLTALRRKLGPARDYIRTVRGTGYRLSAEDHETH